jgi:hypothetical protein
LGVPFSITKTQTFSKSKTGAPGAAAKTVSLTSTSQVFAKNKAGTTTPATITLTATKQNTSAAANWTTSPAVNLTTSDGTIIGTTASNYNTVYLRASDLGANTSVTVTVTCDSIVDTQTFALLNEGADGATGLSALTPILSNSAHTVPADNAGTVLAGGYAGSGTNIRVFEGVGDLLYTSSVTPSAGEFRIADPVVSPSGAITPGSFSVSVSDPLQNCANGLVGKFFNGGGNLLVDAEYAGTYWRNVAITGSYTTNNIGNVGTLPLDSSDTITPAVLPSGVQSFNSLVLSNNGTNAANYGFIAIGYFKPPTTGTYTFTLSSDDYSALWIGDTAVGVNNRTLANAVVYTTTSNSGSVTLNAGQYYAVRYVFEEGYGTDQFTLSWSGPGITTTQDLTQHFKAPPAVNGTYNYIKLSGTDDYYNSVSSLVHFETYGAWGSESSSFTNRTFDRGGGAYAAGFPATSPSPIGSLYALLLNGTSDYVSFNGPDPLYSGGSTTPWTVECWVYTPTGGPILSRASSYLSTDPSSYDFPIWIGLTDGYNAYIAGLYPTIAWFKSGAWYYGSVSKTAVTADTWTHLAFVFTGSGFKIFKDGTDISDNGFTPNTVLATTSYDLISRPEQTWYIGRDWQPKHFNGYIDEFRITKGVARYNSNFTRPSAPFPSDTTYKPTIALGQGAGGVDVGNHSAMSNSVDVATITYPITARRANGTSTALSLTQTITKSKAGTPGTSALSGYLTNESHTIPADSAGTVSSSDYTAAGGSFKVFFGTNDVTANCTFAAPSAITGTVTVSTPNSSTGAYTVSGLTTDSATVGLSATYSGNTISKVYSISKSKSGGAGAPAKTVTLTASSQTFKYDAIGVPAPAVQTINFTVNLQNVTGTATYTIVGYDNNSNSTNIKNNTGNIFSLTNTEFLTNANIVRAVVTVTLDGISDTVTVVKVTDGASSYAMLLTSSSYAIPATNAGAVTLPDTNATTQARVYYGGVDDSANWGFYVSAIGSNITYRDADDGSNRTGTGVVNGYLGGSNLLTNSSTALVFGVNVTMNYNQTTGPDNVTNSAGSIAIPDDPGVLEHQAKILYNWVANTTYTFSGYIKNATHPQVNGFNGALTSSAGAPGNGTFNFSFATGIGSGATFTSVGNGWYRFAVTFTPTISINNGGFFIRPTSGGQSNWDSNTAGVALYFYGMQLETGSVATGLTQTGGTTPRPRGYLSVGSLTQDSSYIEITAYRPGIGSLVQRYSITKAKQGQDGTAVGGSTGPRTASGYVYYTTSSANAPTKPSATKFDFTAGTFTGLTNGWSTTFSVPNLDGNTANLRYWASRYNASEATFNAATNTTEFSDSFVWTNFDGLVTFTNLAAGKDASGTVSNTLIDGASIKTGSITTNSLTVTGFGDSAILNASFEEQDAADSTLPAKWKRYGVWGGTSATAYRDTSQSRSGTASVTLNPGSGNSADIYADAIPVNQGDVWYVSCRAKSSGTNAGSSPGFYLRVRGGAGPTNLGTELYLAVENVAVPSSSTWTQYSGQVTIPEGMKWARPILLNYASNTGAAVTIDEVEFKKAAGAAQIYSLNANTITTGTLDANRINAGTLSVNKLKFVPASLISDPYFLDIPWWTNNYSSGSQFNFTTTDGGTSDSNGWYFDDNYTGNADTMKVVRCITLSPSLVGGNRKHIYSSLIPAPPVGSALRFKARFIPDTNQYIRVTLSCLSDNATELGYSMLQCYKKSTPSQGNYEVNQTFPTGSDTNGVSELVSTKVWDNATSKWIDGVPPGTKYLQVVIYNQANNGNDGYPGNLVNYVSVSNIGVDVAASTEMIPFNAVSTSVSASAETTYSSSSTSTGQYATPLQTSNVTLNVTQDSIVQIVVAGEASDIVHYAVPYVSAGSGVSYTSLVGGALINIAGSLAFTRTPFQTTAYLKIAGAGTITLYGKIGYAYQSSDPTPGSEGVAKATIIATVFKR